MFSAVELALPKSSLRFARKQRSSVHARKTVLIFRVREEFCCTQNLACVVEDVARRIRLCFLRGLRTSGARVGVSRSFFFFKADRAYVLLQSWQSSQTANGICVLEKLAPLTEVGLSQDFFRQQEFALSRRFAHKHRLCLRARGDCTRHVSQTELDPMLVCVLEAFFAHNF